MTIDLMADYTYGHKLWIIVNAYTYIGTTWNGKIAGTSNNIYDFDGKNKKL